MKEAYEIVRFRFNGPESIIKRGLTLEEAQAHCNDPETSSRTATNPEESGDWFDGYREERIPRRPGLLATTAKVLRAERNPGRPDYDPHH